MRLNITRLITSLILTLFVVFNVNAQLAQGDIAIVGMNSDTSPDELTIVTLAAIPSGQTIYISDYPWDGAAFDATQNLLDVSSFKLYQVDFLLPLPY